MKVKQHLQIESVITGKPLPKDLEKMDTQLWKYYSTSQDKVIDFGDMELFHFTRAFKKFLEKQDDNDFAIDSADRVHKSMKERLVQEQEDNKAKDSIIRGLRSQVKKFWELDERIKILEGIIEEKDETIQKLLDKPTWTEQPTNGHRYVFSEIPNNEYGKKLARGMKVFLNDESYTMRVRGQHLKPELYGTGKASYGQSIEDSTHLRIYIDKKKGE